MQNKRQGSRNQGLQDSSPDTRPLDSLNPRMLFGRVWPLFLALCSVVSAGQRLTVEDCVRLGLANNPTLVASQAGIDYADAKSQEANAARLPSLTLTGAYTRLSPISPFVFDIPVPGKPPVAETVVA